MPELEALVFENGRAVIKTFTAKDGDEFYGFFGGMGMTGIIVSATISTVEKTYYQRYLNVLSQGPLILTITPSPSPLTSRSRSPSPP